MDNSVYLARLSQWRQFKEKLHWQRIDQTVTQSVRSYKGIKKNDSY